MALDNLWLQVVYLALAVFFVLLNGFFVAAEFAIVKVRPTQISERVRKGERGAKQAQHIVQNLNPYLNACQLGITLASLALGWVGEPAFARLLEPAFAAMGVEGALLHTFAFGVAFLTITALHIVLGEIVPKTFSIQTAERAAILTARPLHWFYVLFRPAVWALNEASFAILRLFGIRRGGHEAEHSEEEIRLILARTLSREKAAMVMRVFDLGELQARHVMTPRTRIVALDVQRTFDENMAVADDAGYTRFPLVDGNLDNVVGMVHFRDLASLARSPRPKDLVTVKRDVLFIPDSGGVEKLFSDMMRGGRHMAIVLDEFGTTAGLVTLEDIFEELFGEIRDEFDARAEAQYRLVAEGHWIIEGQMPLHDASALVGVALDSHDVTTFGGYVVAEAGHLPGKGERVQLGPFDAIVREADRKRVKLVEVWRRKEGAAEPTLDAPAPGP